MSDFTEFEHALPATARFTLQDGRVFHMTIAEQDEHGNLQLCAIKPLMTSDDFAAVNDVVFLDELGRVHQRMTDRTVLP